MLEALLVILIILWFLGYISIPGLAIPNIVLFTINNRPITLWDILILVVVVWLLSILPSPFREIAGVLLLLWILATLGIFAIGGLSSWIVIAIIAGIVIYMFQRSPEA